ncbi:ABC transporter permease [bacterium]|nr:ABC transporter permease [bacterium]
MHTSAFRNLLYNLVRRDLTVRYKSTVLGFFWSFIKPLALTAIFYAVFSLVLHMTLNETRVPYALHLLAGMLAWSFFAGSTSEAMGVMLLNANLIKKVKLPLVVFPLATVISHLVHFLLGMVVLLALMIIAGLAPGPQCLLIIPIIALEAVLAFAIALILSALNVFWRDVGSIWEVLTTAWFYVTPIIYPFYAVTPEISKYGGRWLEWVYLANPMTPIMIALRRFLLYGSLETIDPKKLEILNIQLINSLGISIVVTGVIFFIGWNVFSKFSRSFADEL